MWLVHAFLPFFGISSYTFFCLALIPVVQKNIAIGPSVNLTVKKKTKINGVSRVPIITRHVAH